MDWKGAAFAGLVMFAVFYVLVYQSPLFLASSNSSRNTKGEQVSVTPFLPASPSSPWLTSGFAYSCGDAGPGTLQITNGGGNNVTIVSVSLYYRGTAYVASGPACLIEPGAPTISITALGAPAGTQFATYSGYVKTSDGLQWSFSGFWE